FNTDGNIIQSVIEVANSIASEMKQDVGDNPDAFQKDIVGFQDMVKNKSNMGGPLGSLIGSLTTAFTRVGDGEEVDGERLMQEFGNVCNESGIDQSVLMGMLGQ